MKMPAVLLELPELPFPLPTLPWEIVQLTRPNVVSGSLKEAYIEGTAPYQTYHVQINRAITLPDDMTKAEIEIRSVTWIEDPEYGTVYKAGISKMSIPKLIEHWIWSVGGRAFTPTTKDLTEILKSYKGKEVYLVIDVAKIGGYPEASGEASLTVTSPFFSLPFLPPFPTL